MAAPDHPTGGSAARPEDRTGGRGSGEPVAAHIRDLVDEVVSAAGYDLEELSLVRAGRRRQLRVVVDSDHGVDLDDAAAVSRAISAKLDALEQDGAGDPLGADPYSLEVTSRGVGRPLIEPRHFRRAVGRLLSLTLTDGVPVVARVLRADDHGIDILTGPRGTDVDRLNFDRIGTARVEVEFSRPPQAVLDLLGPAAQTLTADGNPDPGGDIDDDTDSDTDTDSVDDTDSADDVDSAEDTDTSISPTDRRPEVQR